MPKISTCLWFDGKAEEAMKFYCATFPKAKAGAITRYGDAGPGPKGAVMTATWEIDGHEFLGLNGGSQYPFTPAISLLVHCKTQDEVDGLWETLTTNGGKEVQCGWLVDRFGISWQICPTALLEMMQDRDAERVKRVTLAMMKMKKLDIKALKRAYDGAA